MSDSLSLMLGDKMELCHLDSLLLLLLLDEEPANSEKDTTEVSLEVKRTILKSLKSHLLLKTITIHQ